MRRFHQFILPIILFNFLACTGSYQIHNQPHGLMTEFLRIPEKTEIRTLQPHFSWILPQQTISQTSYQIFLGTAQNLVQVNNPDIWDSGRVDSPQSSCVLYNGPPLENGKTYYWSVITWDENNLISPKSEVQKFSINTEHNSPYTTTPNFFQVEQKQAVEIKDISSDTKLYDFGKAAFANLEFKYRTTEVDTLIVRIGEQLKDGKINRTPQGNIRFQEIQVMVSPNQSHYRLGLKPDARNTGPRAIALPDSFPVLMPFRYAEIVQSKNMEFPTEVIQNRYFSYFDDQASHFESSDSILNQIWELCKYSIKATTFAGLYVDGDRERIPYEADAYLNQLSHYYVDREFTNARQTLEYFMSYPTWPTEWQLHVAMMFYEDYMFTGNLDLIKRYYEDIKYKTLMELEREDGLISTTSPKLTPEFMRKLGFTNPEERLKDIVDWPPAQKDTGWKLATPEGERDGFVFTPINTVVNCFYYRNLVIMEAFAQILGKTEEEQMFRTKKEKVYNAVNEKLFDQANKRYKDGETTDHSSLHSNMLALAFDLVPEKYKADVINYMKTRGMGCSVYGAQYLLEGLYNAGGGDYAFELMTSTSDRSWFNMIRIGSTITLEAWDMKYKPNADWNHAWGAVPANMIPRGIWGVKPIEPGFKTFQIKPQFAQLTASSVTVPTIKGSIEMQYSYHSEKSTVDIQVPGNTKALFSAEFLKVNQIKYDGRNYDPDDQIDLAAGIHKIELY